MLTVRDQEYDAFGPWIIKIEAAELLPRKFRPYVDMSIAYDYLVKVPKNMDRRDLRPGMDIYDAVIGLRGENLYIYEQKDEVVSSEVISASEVYSIVLKQNLLAGYLYLQLERKEYLVQFNTISVDMIHELINRIRHLSTSSSKTWPLNNLSEEVVGEMDHYYTSEWRDQVEKERNPDILAIQAITKLTYEGMNFFSRALKRVAKSHLKSCLYMSNGKELILSKHGEDYKEFRKADYSISYTYIPFSRIRTIEEKTTEDVPEVIEYKVGVGGKDYSFLFHESNEYGQNFYETLRQVCM